MELLPFTPVPIVKDANEAQASPLLDSPECYKSHSRLDQTRCLLRDVLSLLELKSRMSAPWPDSMWVAPTLPPPSTRLVALNHQDGCRLYHRNQQMLPIRVPRFPSPTESWLLNFGGQATACAPINLCVALCRVSSCPLTFHPLFSTTNL